MADVFIHSSSAVLAIVRSGKFIGSNKAMAKLGSEFRDATKSQGFSTLFVEWGKNSLRESLSRLNKPNKNDIRGAFVFTDPGGKIDKSGKYPSLAGDEVSLSKLSLRALILLETDFPDGFTYGKDIEPHVSKIKGSIFGLYIEPALDDDHRIEEILKEARLHGCFT